MNRLGAVIIGRNEGQRLRACLESITSQCKQIVYVDSGSTDGSVALAKSFNAHVVELDMSLPFTAARARNAGYRELKERFADIEFVQFVDGDCEVVPGWLEAGTDFLRHNPNVAVVCGRRREKQPQASIYNLLCDIEWDTPIGEAKACGGDAIMRVSAFDEVSGYRDDFIAGEEPELCVRLRAASWKIQRLDHEMTLHDAAMYHFKQWWKRTVRGGYAFALGASLHGKPPERHWVRETLRATFWGGALPLAIVFMAVIFSGWWLLLLVVYPLQVLRTASHIGRSSKENFFYAVFVMLGKFAEFQGQLRFLRDWISGRRAKIIEYK